MNHSSIQLPILQSRIQGALVGLAVGDALGVPVEFTDRDQLRENPVTTMRGMGVWMQPAGTWSDDSSMAFYLAESLMHGFDVEDQGRKYVQWAFENYLTPHGEVFDIGMQTTRVLRDLHRGHPVNEDTVFGERANGNGSLMRCAPLSCWLLQEPDIQQRVERIAASSSVTHGHIRSVVSCFIYTEFALGLLLGRHVSDAYAETIATVQQYMEGRWPSDEEQALFDRVLNGELANLPEDAIASSGYVLHTLEASLWCMLQGGSFDEIVLRAVNLGGDTDTTGAVTGSLAGMYFGIEAISSAWRNELARSADVHKLASTFANSVLL